jgi:ubiquinone/menaquinone biosynthesis C-methylase UbiE
MSAERARMSFEEVDRESNPSDLVTYLDSASALDGIRQYKEASLRLLSLKEGAHCLEVGCGAGDDALAMAALVGPNGRVVGVDVSEAMISAANGGPRAKDCPWSSGGATHTSWSSPIRRSMPAGPTGCCNIWSGQSMRYGS